MSDPATATAATPNAPTGPAATGAVPVTVVVQVRLQALAVPEPGGGYSVVVPALPGCFTEGEDIEEVQANLVEAAEAWLDSQFEHRKASALREGEE
jgi:predicted RNase H-like HicB family nuclease